MIRESSGLSGEGVFAVEQIGSFFLVFAVGFAGFLLLRLLKAPSPALLGSIFATGLMNILGLYPDLRTQAIGFLAKATTGAMLGRQINRQLFAKVRGIVPYALLSTAGMFAASLATGYALYCLSDISLVSALISSAAGGITEMTTFGLSVNADVVAILFMQILRLLIFLTLTPYIAMFIERASPAQKTKRLASVVKAEARPVFFERADYLRLTGAALCGAFLFTFLRVPSGAMMGSMLACGALALFLKKTYRFDMRFRYVAQVVLGLITGQRITPDIVGELGHLLLPGLLATGLMLVASTLLALILYRVSKMDLVTCILCTAPAGLTQTAFIADEIGADPLLTSIFHIFRLPSIIAFYPWIVMMIV